MPRVVKSADYAQSLADAVGIAKPRVCRLRASEQTLLTRVHHRELGSGLAWHEKRAIELARQMERDQIQDFCLDTDERSIGEIAGELLGKVDWAR